MKFIPHNYQQYAIDFIKANPVAALLLDMGLGRQNIGYIKKSVRATGQCV